MPVTFFDEGNDGRLPFLKEYLETAKKANGTQHTVVSVSPVKSGKGYMLNTAKFCVFLWKNDRKTGTLISLVESWVDGTAEGCLLVIQIDLDNKEQYKLGMDAEVPCTWLKKETDFIPSVI